MSGGNVGPFRGGTLRFATTFYDLDGAEVQPAGAIINIVYQDADGAEQTTQLTMNAPSGSETRWTALFDTRDVGPGVVFWSVHSLSAGDIVPFAVEDGYFSILANTANLPTF